MTAQTAIRAQHATLSTTTADSVTFSGTGSSLCITNRDSSVSLYFTATGGATAVSAADDTYVVLPLQSKIISVASAGGTTGLVVSIVGNGNAYSAEII